MARACSTFPLVISTLVLVLSKNALSSPSAANVLQDVYSSCLQDLSVSCAKAKALKWMNEVKNDQVIHITEELVVVKKDNPTEIEQERGLEDDIFEKFENFIQTHDLVAKPPALLGRNGELGNIIPRSFQAEELKVPMATGRSSKIVKKVILPFLLGLKFKTAIVVPLVLALIALKTWKALTLGLLSLVLTGALLIFKITKPKAATYEVLHYPQHVDHHIDHPAVISDHPVYGRALSANELAYNAYLS